jgi:ABC-type xylose transport system substrate-binding protein
MIMINGAPTDNNAKLFKLGALSELKTQRVRDRQAVRHARLKP